MLERGRGAGAGVILAGQSAVALGSEEERARLLAAASAILLFRTPQPAELAALAGSERVAEGAWGFDKDATVADFERVTVTMRARARVDQDQVRQLPTGEADLIVRGLAERVRIIRTNIPDAVRTMARGLAAPPAVGTLHPPAPGRAVASREVPAPPTTPQEPSVPTGRPTGALDPPPTPQVRRYRPPGSGEEHPTTDRNPEGVP